jgi:hypothetical protein
MEYQSLVEMPLRFQVTGTPEERDLLTSLRGFQLKSIVQINGTIVARSTRVRISFASWRCRVTDRYDFDYTEHFTIPNPDFTSTDSNAVRPRDREITVYHTNAQRLERALQAAPYDIEMEWQLTDASITGPTEVDRSRSLQSGSRWWPF